MESECYKKLKELEQKGIPQRIEVLAKFVKEQEDKEAENQKTYHNLLIEKQNLLKL